MNEGSTAGATPWPALRQGVPYEMWGQKPTAVVRDDYPGPAHLGPERLKVWRPMRNPSQVIRPSRHLLGAWAVFLGLGRGGGWRGVPEDQPRLVHVLEELAAGDDADRQAVTPAGLG